MPEHFPDQCFFFNRAELCAIHTVWVGAGDGQVFWMSLGDNPAALGQGALEPATPMAYARRCVSMAPGPRPATRMQTTLAPPPPFAAAPKFAGPRVGTYFSFGAQG